MFIRKDKVEMVGPQYYEGYNEPYYDYREPVYERPQPKDEYYDEPKHESEAEKAHTVYDQEKDKYDQFPKRAVESEYNTVETSEGEPSVLSRQAKYKQKSTEELGIEDDGYYAEPEVDPKELKAQQKREKAEIKAKKKEKRKAYNQRMKERRKNQPSAVSQRRMNFEERRQIYNNDITEERNSSEVKDNNKHE